MYFNQDGKLLEIARLLNEHQGEKGVAAFISKTLKVSGRDVGKVKRMINDGLIVFNDHGEPTPTIPLDKVNVYFLGKVVREWAAKRGISLGDTNKIVDELVKTVFPFLPKRRRGRPKGSSLKPQLSTLYALMNGQKSFQGIVDATGLHRNTVAKNLKMLTSMEMVTKNKIGVRSIYQIHPIKSLSFLRYIALKGNLKVKKIMETVQKEKKPFEELFKYGVYYGPELVELLSDEPELLNGDLYALLQFAEDWYHIKRMKEKIYLPTRPMRSPIPKVREVCLSVGSDINEIACDLLKTFLRAIMKTEDIRNLILSGRTRYLSLKTD